MGNKKHKKHNYKNTKVKIVGKSPSVDTDARQSDSIEEAHTRFITSDTTASDPDIHEKATVDASEIETVCEKTTEESYAESIVESSKSKRIWEVDFVRGLMILFVVWDHFMWDVADIGTHTYKTVLFKWLYGLSTSYYGGALRAVTHDVFVTMFVLTSGVSCSFSRSNGKRALKMCIFAVLFTVLSYAASAMVQTDLTIYFNVIHVIALSVAIYAAIEWIWSKLTKNWQKNIFGVLYFAVTMTALVVGHCAKHMNINWMNLIFGTSEWRTNILNKLINGGDYLSFLPDFGWFLVGAFLGKIIYRKRETVFPSVDVRYVSPVTFCGRYSIWIYFGSQIVMYGLIYLLHEMYQIL